MLKLYNRNKTKGCKLG